MGKKEPNYCALKQAQNRLEKKLKRSNAFNQISINFSGLHTCRSLVNTNVHILSLMYAYQLQD